MALDNQTLTILGVAAILLAVLVWNATIRSKAKSDGDDGSADTERLCKFVTHGGSVVGETVAFEDGNAILKQAGVYKVVPEAQLRPDGADLELTGEIDWAAAEADGAAWQEANKGSGSEGITDQLTRSEDVKAPALEAMAAREEDDASQADGEEE